MGWLCRFVGHRWCDPVWHSYEAWEACRRCDAHRQVISLDTLAIQFGLRFLATLPVDVSSPVVEHMLRTASRATVSAALRELGLTVDADADNFQAVAAPPSWIPAIRRAIETLPDHSALDIDAIERFFGSIRNHVVAHLLPALESNWTVPGLKVSERFVEQREVTANYVKGEEEESGGSMGRYVRGYSESWDVYLVDVVEHTFAARYPVAAGARTALCQLMPRDPTESALIERALQAYEERAKTKVVTRTAEERKTFLRHDGTWTCTYRDVDAR